MKDAGVIRRVKDGVRILGGGEIKAKVTLEIAGITASAREAVEKAGGSVTIIAGKTAPADADAPQKDG